MLWLEDLPANIGVVVGVSGKDDINNAAAIFEYVEICRKKRKLAASLLKSPSFDSLSNNSSKSFRKSPSFSGFKSPNSIQKVNVISKIEGILWPDFIHGQVLLGGKQLRDLAQIVHDNERKS